MLKNYNKELDLYEAFNIIDRVCFNNFLRHKAPVEIIEYEKLPNQFRGMIDTGLAIVSFSKWNDKYESENGMFIYIYKKASNSIKLGQLLHEMVHCWFYFHGQQDKDKFTNHGKKFFKLQHQCVQKMKNIYSNIRVP